MKPMKQCWPDQRSIAAKPGFPHYHFLAQLQRRSEANTEIPYFFPRAFDERRSAAKMADFPKGQKKIFSADARTKP